MPTLTKDQQQLVVQHMPLAHKIVHQLVQRNPSFRPYYDDLVQTALLRMSMSAARFDLARGVPFTTFVYWLVEHHVYQAARSLHNPLHNYRHTIERGEAEEVDSKSFAPEYDSELDIRTFLAEYERGLSNTDKLDLQILVQRTVDEVPRKVVARRRKSTLRSISERTHQARKRLQDAWVKNRAE